MTQDLMNAMYEDGKTVAEIAEAVGKDPSEVTALLGSSDDAGDPVKLREAKHCRILRRVRSMADALTLQYLERLQETIDSPDSDAKQRAAAFEEMEKVLKIAKLYSDRVLLAEGKMTENIGLHGGNALPFSVMFTKTYATENTESSEKKGGTTNEHE